MREIKFRAWHKRGGVMYQWADLIRVYNLCVLTDSSFEIMQYTGLKDKHGKEIYEGDVVKCSRGEYTDKYNRLDIHVVEWDVEVAGFNPMCNACDYDDVHYQGYEVIGNIYENPGLMD